MVKVAIGILEHMAQLVNPLAMKIGNAVLDKVMKKFLRNVQKISNIFKRITKKLKINIQKS